MKVPDMLEFLGTLTGASPSDARKESQSWLERLNIADWSAKKVEELSKGMQQKIQFAAAVLGKPPILILDEPFSGMDTANQNLFRTRSSTSTGKQPRSSSRPTRWKRPSGSARRSRSSTRARSCCRERSRR